MSNDRLFFQNSDKEAFTRYDIGRFLEFTDSFDPLTSTFLEEVSDLPLGGYYTIQGEDGRPDLVSYSIYEDTQYWWVIMAYNNINVIGDIENGNKIKFPKTSALEDFYLSLKTRERVSE